MKFSARIAKLIFCLIFPTNAFATQFVQPLQEVVTAAAGSAFTFAPIYSVSSPATGTETGLAVRIHFDADVLQLDAISKPFVFGLQPVGDVVADTQDWDKDPDTDHYFTVAWVDCNAQWPGSDSLPLTLFNALFTPKADFVGTTRINTSAVSTAKDAVFNSGSMRVNVEQGITLKARAFLQAAYVNTSIQMHDKLRQSNLLPTQQPYQSMGHAGGEVLLPTVLQQMGLDAPVDWVLLELRSQQQPQQIAARKAAILQRDGDIVDAATGSDQLAFSSIAAGNYYVVIHHRSHLGVSTAQAVTLSDKPSYIDFTQASTAIYGEEVRVAQGNYLLVPSGDLNQDGRLIGAGPNNDSNGVLGEILASEGNTSALANYQHSAYSAADMNMDGKVIFVGPGNDVNVLLGNILLHPTNTTSSSNYILNGNMPE